MGFKSFACMGKLLSAGYGSTRQGGHKSLSSRTFASTRTVFSTSISCRVQADVVIKVDFVVA